MIKYLIFALKLLFFTVGFSQELFDEFRPSMHITDSSINLGTKDDSLTIVQYYDNTGNSVSTVEYYPNGKIHIYYSHTAGMGYQNFELNCVKWEGDELVYYAITGPGKHFSTYEVDSLYNITYMDMDMFGIGTETVYDSSNKLIRTATFFNSDFRVVEYYPSGNLRRVYQRWKGVYYGTYTEFDDSGRPTIIGKYPDLDAIVNGDIDVANETLFKHGDWLYYENGELAYTEVWKNNTLIRTKEK